MKSRVATVSLLVALLTPVPWVEAAPPPSIPVSDTRIDESSALVDLGRTMVTTNDSGDTARLFVVSASTGKTIGITRYRGSVQDVEALAPAGGNQIWVGDIGDNESERRSVSVFRVKVSKGGTTVSAPRYRLAYPDGSHNAESMFVDAQGNLNLVTKSFGGGTVYRAPSALSTTSVNRLRVVGKVVEFATDAAMTLDRRHLLVRGPMAVGVYSVPGFERVASFALPRQRQGEGISVGPGGRVRISSEGAKNPIREVVVPAKVLQALAAAPAAPATSSATPAPSASPSPSASASPSATPDAQPSPPPSNGETSSQGFASIDPPWLMWCIPGVIAVGALGIGLGLRRRSE
ncbi:MAG: hypothetical protein ABWX73_12060 [Marmoricola sp.]